MRTLRVEARPIVCASPSAQIAKGPPAFLTGRFRVVIGPKEVERNVRFVADDPAVVRHGRNVKKFTGAQFKNAAVIQCCCRGAGKDQADVLDLASSRTHVWTDMFAPLPAWLIGGAADRHPAKANQLELALSQDTQLIRRVEPLENNADLFRVHRRDCSTPCGQRAKLASAKVPDSRPQILFISLP